MALFAVVALSSFALAAEAAGDAPDTTYPLIVLCVGIVTVLGLIIGFKLNAFLALIVAALVVSLLSGAGSNSIGNVTKAFGGSAGGIGVVIAMAAIIGKCMLTVEPPIASCEPVSIFLAKRKVEQH